MVITMNPCHTQCEVKLNHSTLDCLFSPSSGSSSKNELNCKKFTASSAPTIEMSRMNVHVNNLRLWS